ncbi:hypothetical protein M3Y99_00033700 [Aphelenchoides fujianensis]|nr:hypothetical protein M3Y99_00033700 [Aphelenchoides fujianensis]
MGGSQQSKIKESPLFVDTSGWPDGRKTSRMTVDRFRSADPARVPQLARVPDAPARVANRFTLRAVLKEDKRLDSPSGSSEWSGGTSSADISPQSPPASVRSIRTSASTVSQFSWTRATAADRPPLYRNAEGEFYVAFHGERFRLQQRLRVPVRRNLFPTALHYFVYQKALSCGNKSIAERVVVEREVEKAKGTSRQTARFQPRELEQDGSDDHAAGVFGQIRAESLVAHRTLPHGHGHSRLGLRGPPLGCRDRSGRSGRRESRQVEGQQSFAQEKEIAERRQKRAKQCV